MNRPKFDFNQWVFWLDLTSKKVRKFQVKAIKMGKYGYEYSGDDNDIVNDIVPEGILCEDRETAIKLGMDELISLLEDGKGKQTDKKCPVCKQLVAENDFVVFVGMCFDCMKKQNEVNNDELAF